MYVSETYFRYIYFKQIYVVLLGTIHTGHFLSNLYQPKFQSKQTNKMKQNKMIFVLHFFREERQWKQDETILLWQMTSSDIFFNVSRGIDNLTIGLSTTRNPRFSTLRQCILCLDHLVQTKWSKILSYGLSNKLPLVIINNVCSVWKMPNMSGQYDNYFTRLYK